MSGTFLPITELTITFIESRYPSKLLKHLKKTRGYTVAKTDSGIYTVKGDILPIQIVDSRKLSAQANIWLKSLSNRLDLSAFKEITDRIMRLEKATQIMAYLNAIAYANEKITEEAIEMFSLPKNVEKALEKKGYYAKWEAKAERRERKKWQTVVAANEAEIARLRTQLEMVKNK